MAPKKHTQAGLLLQLLPPSARSALQALLCLVAGWGAHEVLDGGGGGRRAEGRRPPLLLTPEQVDTATARILGQSQPPAAPNLRRLGDNFLAEMDSSTRNPRWVAELLTPTSLHGPAGRREGHSFREEASLHPHMRARLADYVGSGYDRGHMAAAANHRSSDAALSDTFFLSNVAPQDAGLNREYWARMEAWVRSLVRAPGDESGGWEEVRVLTGPLYLPEPSHVEGRPPRTAWTYKHAALGAPGAWLPVPSHFFKVVLATRKGGGGGVDAAAAFVVPNTGATPPGRPLTDFLVPLATLEGLSGLQLFRERLGEEGVSAVDAGLSTPLQLSADPSSSRLALALHVARALNPEGSKGKPWPAFLTVPSPVPARVKGGRGGDDGGEAPPPPRAWHLCALTPCVLPEEHNERVGGGAGGGGSTAGKGKKDKRAVE